MAPAAASRQHRILLSIGSSLRDSLMLSPELLDVLTERRLRGALCKLPYVPCPHSLSQEAAAEVTLWARIPDCRR